MSTIASILILALSAPLVTAQAEVSDNVETIGVVSMVLGKAYLHTSDQPPLEITRGLPVRVSDKVVTELNGHVHIRFVDDALVSVRPGSELEIVSYVFQSENPEKSSIKFNLVEGVTRSISGKGAKAARTRFRLNTPIAAIGVRGTDFVVSASEETVRALVNEGTIVLSPFSDECSIESFGPCNTSNSVELRGQSFQVLELRSTERLPLLTSQENEQVSVQQQSDFAGVQATTPVVQQTDSEDQTSDNDAFLEVKTVTVASELENSNTPIAEPDPFAQLPDFTPDAGLDEASLTESQLLWGRFSLKTELLENERITVPFEVAKEGRQVTVGNHEYALFRAETDTKLVDRELGIISFALNSAQAFYYSESGVVVMHVNGGNLDVDFSERLFQTQLDLSHRDTGIVNFEASGRISKSGYFFSNSEQQRIAGSTSIDGTQAGYFFEQQLESGGIQGLTLWDNR